MNFLEKKLFYSDFLRCLRQLCKNGNRLLALHEFDKMKTFHQKFHLSWIKYVMIRTVLMSTYEKNPKVCSSQQIKSFKTLPFSAFKLSRLQQKKLIFNTR